MATKWTITGPLANTLDAITTGPTNRATAFVSGMSTNMTAKLKRNSVEVLSATIPGPLTSSSAVATLALTTAPAATITTTDLDDGASYVFELISGDGNSKASAPAGPTPGSTIPIEVSEDLDSASTVNIGPLNFDFDVDLVAATPQDYDSGTISGTTTSISLPAVASQGIAVITLVFASTTTNTPPSATISGWTTAFDRFLSNPVGGAARAARHVQFYREGSASAGAVTVNYGSAVIGAFTYYTFANRSYEKSASAENTNYSANPFSPFSTTSYTDTLKLVHMTTNQYRRQATTSNASVTTTVSSQDAPSIAGAFTTQASSGSVSSFGWTLTDPVGGSGQEQTQSSVTLLYPFGASPVTGGGGGSGSFTEGSPPNDGAGSWQTIHTAGEQPIQIPWYFYGWHRSQSDQPLYQYNADRNWDFSVNGGADCSWARCNPSNGVYNWSGPDQWIARTDGKFRLWTVSLTPEWAVAPSDRIYPGAGAVRYPTFPNGSFPPGSQSYLATFIQAVINRYGSNIDAFELWNEPTTPDTSPDSRRFPSTLGAFYSGSLRELAVMGRTIKQTIRASAHPNIPLWWCGWEGQFQNTTNTRPKTFATVSDGAGGVGIDHVDVLSFHPYMYNADPVRVWNEVLGYRAQLESIAATLGRPSIATMPINADETGHEDPNIATNYSFEVIAKDLKQSVGYALAGAKYGCTGIILYQDSPQPRTFRSPINANSLLVDAANYAHNANTTKAVGGKIIRQISIRTGASGLNPQTWIRFDDNSEYLA